MQLCLARADRDTQEVCGFLVAVAVQPREDEHLAGARRKAGDRRLDVEHLAGIGLSRIVQRFRRQVLDGAFDSQAFVATTAPRQPVMLRAGRSFRM